LFGGRFSHRGDLVLHSGQIGFELFIAGFRVDTLLRYLLQLSTHSEALM
jgi:hypothetical protein